MKRFDPAGGRLLPLAPLVPPSGIVPATSKGQASSEQASADDIGAVLTGGTNDGILAVYNTMLRAVNLTNSDKGSTARAAHEAAANPHPQYAALAGAAFTGNVGIGTSAPAGAFHVDNGVAFFQRYGTTGAMVSRRANGSQSTPTAVPANSGVGLWVSRAFDGSLYRDVASIEMQSSAAVTGTSSSGRIIFSVTPVGATSPATRAVIEANGDFNLGSTPRMYLGTAPESGARLSVDGQLSVGAATSTGGVVFVYGDPGAGYIESAQRNNAAKLPLQLQPFGGSIGIGLGTTAPTAPLDISGTTVRLRTARTPASATAAGNQGDICWDANFLYVCVAANTWRRVAHATW